MFVKTRTVNGKIHATLVRSYRKDGKVLQKQIMNFGIIEKEQLPYLKAAFAKEQPMILYNDGTVYDPKTQERYDPKTREKQQGESESKES